MFEVLFTYPGVVRRHREGPLSTERTTYLSELGAQGLAQGTILRRARYALCVALELQHWPPTYRFDEDEVEALARSWAAKRFACGRASGPRWPTEHFRFAAKEFLRSLGRLRPPEAPEASRYDAELTEFIASQQEGRWQSEATCRSARWQIARFFAYLELRGMALSDVAASDVDAFFGHMAQRWSRRSLRTSAHMLRAWFGYCERQGWVRPGLAGAVLLPRLYRHEGLPLGPTWGTVGQILEKTNGDDATAIRDHAIVLLLSVYGLRSGEVRGLCLDDMDWVHDQLHIVRSKSKREEIAPLEARVGNAIARYLRDGRPKTHSRFVFLTLRAPHRPLSASGLYGVVARYLSESELPKRGRGPHGLRHACARHLVESGRSFKEVGDHLGHRSPDATSVYAKVNLTSLRQVAFDDLGGLA